MQLKCMLCYAEQHPYVERAYESKPWWSTISEQTVPGLHTIPVWPDIKSLLPKRKYLWLVKGGKISLLVPEIMIQNTSIYLSNNEEDKENKKDHFTVPILN